MLVLKGKFSYVMAKTFCSNASTSLSMRSCYYWTRYHILAVDHSSIGSSRNWIYFAYSDRQALANTVDPNQTPHSAASDQGLQCFEPIQRFYSHPLVVKLSCSSFRTSISRSVGVRIFWVKYSPFVRSSAFVWSNIMPRLLRFIGLGSNGTW